MISDNHGISVITPPRKNQKDKYRTPRELMLLGKRKGIENTFAFLKKL